jgi:hypothetical protein
MALSSVEKAPFSAILATFSPVFSVFFCDRNEKRRSGDGTAMQRTCEPLRARFALKVSGRWPLADSGWGLTYGADSRCFDSLTLDAP